MELLTDALACVAVVGGEDLRLGLPPEAPVSSLPKMGFESSEAEAFVLCIFLLSTGAVFGVGLIDRDLEIYSLSRLLIMGVERVGTTAEGIVADDGRALAGGDQWSA